MNTPKHLKAREEIDIVAGVTKSDQLNVTFGVRWAIRPDLGFPSVGFPSGGFTIKRFQKGRGNDATRTWPVIFLPGSQEDPADSPLIKPPMFSYSAFVRDASQRRPSFELDGSMRTEQQRFQWLLQSEDRFKWLLPILALASPHLDGKNLHTDKRLPFLKACATYFGFPHRMNEVLRSTYWRNGDPPNLGTILKDSSAANEGRLGAVLAFYRDFASKYLLVLALRYSLAALVGLALEDVVPRKDLHDLGDVKYEVQTFVVDGVSQRNASAQTEWLTPDEELVPIAPLSLKGNTTPTTAEHPLFARWRRVSSWHAPILEPATEGPPAYSPASVFPSSPSTATVLAWSRPSRGAGQRLLHLGPVLYRLGRHVWGAGSADGKDPYDKKDPEPTFTDFTEDYLIAVTKDNSEECYRDAMSIRDPSAKNTPQWPPAMSQ